MQSIRLQTCYAINPDWSACRHNYIKSGRYGQRHFSAYTRAFYSVTIRGTLQLKLQTDDVTLTVPYAVRALMFCLNSYIYVMDVNSRWLFLDIGVKITVSLNQFM